MIVLPYLSAVGFRGADAGDFLHNQLSADVLGLSTGQSVFACYCEPKGRVLVLVLVYKQEDSYVLIMASSLAPAMIDRLKIYVFRSQVSIELLVKLKVVGRPGESNVAVTQEPVAVIDLPGGSDQLLLVSTGSMANVEATKLDEWRYAELQRGVVWLSAQTSEQFLPQMLGFDLLGAVNFSKGCYPGQEIIARTHYLGKVKRHPRWLSTERDIKVAAMDKICIYSDEQKFDAVVVDSVQLANGTTGFWSVTRMAPELQLDKIEQYQGKN